jgi:flagellar hook assembly protein FlgD
VVDWFEPARAEVVEPDIIPVGGFALGQNFPNPFKAATTIAFTVPDPGRDVRLTIYNVSGQVVRSLVGGPLAGSAKTVVWDAQDDAGRSVPSGVYFYRLTVGNTSLHRKMLFLK